MRDADAVASAASMLMQASRILAQAGVVDGFGHVSMRHPLCQDHFLIPRSMAPALVEVEDVMTLDLTGASCDGDERRPFLERFIHAAIYKARSDVGAVVHSHSHGVIPFGVVREARLRPIFHMAGFIGTGLPVFEIREAAGESSDMLIRTEELGTALAAKLGTSAAILMRGHGSTCVGRNVQEAVFRAIYLEANARLQMDASKLGPITFLNEAEARNADAANAGQIGRAWELWCKSVSASAS